MYLWRYVLRLDGETVLIRVLVHYIGVEGMACLVDVDIWGLPVGVVVLKVKVAIGVPGFAE